MAAQRLSSADRRRPTPGISGCNGSSRTSEPGIGNKITSATGGTKQMIVMASTFLAGNRLPHATVEDLNPGAKRDNPQCLIID
jgi:hypothetical protein